MARKILSDAALQRVTDLAAYPLVEIHWTDACSSDSWATVKEARDEATPVDCLTVGRLIRNDRVSVAVAQTVAKHGKVAAVWTVPRGWVKRVRVLK